MKPVLFVTATAKEMKAALGGTVKLPVLEQGKEIPVRLGSRSGLLLVTGIGVINTALSLGRVLAEHDPGLVIMVGIAGTFVPEKFPLGTSCMVRTEIWPEYGLKKGHDVDPKGIGFCLAQTAGGPVWDRVELLSGKSLDKSGLDRLAKLPEAVSLTVSGVTATLEGAARFRIAYAADLENMEGFAAAYACTLAGVDMCELRTVSNIVGSRDSCDWDLNGALTGLGRICSGLFG
ncbi:futalosine hydrolase [Maridesulfovibrio sp. FT414]|uniref:futalosine hydrolase n=1 Tax=Maridesulfovibrio sp. FT414 TaxID=2979469 RepID=UPI003D80061D